MERSGKIEKISYVDHEGPAGSNHRPAGVLKWVHDNLDGHEYVIPKKKWEDKEEEQFVLLDLWFGGAGKLAIHMRYRREVPSPEEENWSNYDPENDSDATLSEDVLDSDSKNDSDVLDSNSENDSDVLDSNSENDSDVLDSDSENDSDATLAENSDSA
ncbi:hypothetical protein A1F99_106930 [Pyrenophora tritici-repentis]|nr:hypothetical protein A1F99_106930 [Pyrenophora tritici-repentis]